MNMLKRMTQISGAAIRLTIGIGGAVLVFLTLKDKVKRGTSKNLQSTSKFTVGALFRANKNTESKL
jgi:hypothetical protein